MMAGANAAAAGLMLSATAALLIEGGRKSIGLMLIGAVAGVILVLGTTAVLERFPPSDRTPGSSLGSRGLLVMLVMTAHSLAEGVGIGVGFADGATFGIAVTIAMAVHNIPEGMAISLALAPRGISVTRAAMLSIVSSLPQPIAAIPAFIFVQQFSTLLPAGLGFAGGAMAALALSDLLPEALRDGSRPKVLATGMAAFVAMSIFQYLLLR
jgi:zinc transporter ZupT